MRILIVDDNTQNLYVLATLLGAHGHEVETASNGLEALDRLSHQSFDLIVSDILMPQMDGFQLCRRVKSDERLRVVTFVFYTATYTDPKDEEFALSLGAEKFVVKPQEPEQFVRIIDEVIASRESGTLAPGKPAVEEEEVYLREYTERLVKKLEDKLVEVEHLNRSLRESEQKYRDLVDNANDGVIVIEHSGFLSFANQMFCHMTGYPGDECDRLHLSQFVHPEELERLTEQIRRILDGDEPPKSYETRFVSKTGSTVYADINLRGIRRDERVAAVQGIARDVTLRRQLEEQLRQSQKMDAIGRLAGGVAHDFNNLLTAIIGYNQLALGHLDPSDLARREIEEALKASQRAAALTSQLLAFSRRQVMRARVLDLNTLIRDLDKMLRRLIGENIEVALLLDPAIGHVRADASQLEQVLINLAVNARDAMPEGGMLKIETANADLDEEFATAHPEVVPGPYVLLAVTDTGTGMDAETQSRAFEPFFTTKPQGTRTGLGLSTVYGIIRQSGGHIILESEPAKGSSFRILLPRVEQPVEPHFERPHLANLPRGGETILLVEDEPLVRQLGLGILHTLGYKVIEAADGQEALAVAEAHANEPIHLLLSDVVMPRMGGKELAERLRLTRPDIKVLFASGYTDEAFLNSSVLGPGTGFIQKPFAPAMLARKVREVLDE